MARRDSLSTAATSASRRTLRTPGQPHPRLLDPAASGSARCPRSTSSTGSPARAHGLRRTTAAGPWRLLGLRSCPGRDAVKSVTPSTDSTPTSRGLSGASAAATLSIVAAASRSVTPLTRCTASGVGGPAAPPSHTGRGQPTKFSAEAHRGCRHRVSMAGSESGRPSTAPSKTGSSSTSCSTATSVGGSSALGSSPDDQSAFDPGDFATPFSGAIGDTSDVCSPVRPSSPGSAATG